MNPINISEDRLLTYKVIAEGLLPKPDNMKVDFVEEAQNPEQAINLVKKQIDQYLEKHEIQNFVYESSEQ